MRLDLTPRSSPVNDPAYWRQRCEEARAIADQIDEPVAKQTVMTIASGYEQMAALASAYPLTGEREQDESLVD